jgi:hypothetical protein
MVLSYGLELAGAIGHDGGGLRFKVIIRPAHDRYTAPPHDDVVPMRARHDSVIS